MSGLSGVIFIRDHRFSCSYSLGKYETVRGLTSELIEPFVRRTAKNPDRKLSKNDFETVIVENHPGLCGKRVYDFQHGLAGQLEIALGLETVHPQVLPWLNKQMTLPQYRATVEDLVAHDVRVRTFILVKPPFLNEQEGVFWAMESMRFAFKCGVECCSMVPVRGGNGLMDRLQQDGDFTPPTVASLEQVLVAGLEMGGGRVFMDLWDSDQFLAPECCKQQRLSRLMKMNQTQQVQPEVQCDTCG